ncbi:MAG: class I SAM-dependent methyltransferase [Candidatus Parcubacteria bacterium]|nr:class I SAM-dependent methyltransferase [Candidatus Parcubacteria bacterium]
MSNIVYSVRNLLAEEEERNKVFFTNFDFVENELKLTKDIFENHIDIDRKGFYGQYAENEKCVLFNMVQWLKPKKIVEFSPSEGYTTLTIAAATMGYASSLEVSGGLSDNKPCGFESFETYEFDPECVRKSKENLKQFGFDRVQVIEGDVLQTMDLEKLSRCDFFFIDSDHNKTFVEKYVDKFFHLIPKGTWVAVHDVAFDPINGETQVITDWLKKNNREKYFYVRDLANRFGVNDRVPNLWNMKDTETSTTLWWKND